MANHEEGINVKNEFWAGLDIGKEKLFNNKCASCLNKCFWVTLSLSNDCIKDFDKTGFKRRYILLLLMTSGNILFGICR